MKKTILSATKFVTIGLAMAVGYFVGSTTQKAKALVQSDKGYAHEGQPRSFSEVEYTRSSLAAISSELIMEVRSDLMMRKSAQKNSREAVPVEDLLLRLQKSLAEFQDTDQEYILRREILTCLKQGKHLDRWLDFYIGSIWKQPTHPLIGTHLNEAMEIAATQDRLDELIAAMEWMNSIPGDFPGKAILEPLLKKTAGSHLAKNSHNSMELERARL